MSARNRLVIRVALRNEDDAVGLQGLLLLERPQIDRAHAARLDRGQNALGDDVDAEAAQDPVHPRGLEREVEVRGHGLERRDDR